MTSRERVNLALDHRETDRVPFDLGASTVTGMHVSMVYKTRQALGLDPPGTPVKVVEPYQMLGEVAPDLIEALGIDVVGLGSPRTLFGFENKGWKEWKLFDNTPVLVPEGFNTDPNPDGSIFLYPEGGSPRSVGDKSVPPSGVMPKGGFFFDSIVRQPPIDDDDLNPEDNLEEFGPISDSDLEHFRIEAERIYTQTDKAILANFGGAAFGDIALVPAPWLKHPKGIRDIEEWYVSTAIRRDYVYTVFECQCEIALGNLAKIHGVVGDRVSAVFITGADFGTQRGLFISVGAYRDLYKPFHQQVNDWIHRHTAWKTFIHSCGSVAALIPDFIDAGFDILNPVQCSAFDMEAQSLKTRFGSPPRSIGDRITFWGGGVDTQQTLPFGTPEQVRAEVQERIKIFGKGGGFVFNAIHNIQSGTPVENLLAMLKTIRE